MTQITLKGNPVKTLGELPSTGTELKDCELVKTDLSRVSLSGFKGSKQLLNIFPSVDTGTCAMSVRKFNKDASELENTKVLCISKDLPFAQDRFCGAEGIDDVIMLSDYETGAFGKEYGVEISEGPMKGLLSRAVVVIDEQGKVVYTEQVQEMSDEPDYEKALEALRG